MNGFLYSISYKISPSLRKLLLIWFLLMFFCCSFQFLYLCTINGTNGIKDGGKIVRSVVFSTICPSVLKKFSWTGNSGFNQPGLKKDFKQKKNIFGIFFDVIYAYDKKYTKMDCEDDLKNRIFKHIRTQADKVWVFIASALECMHFVIVHLSINLCIQFFFRAKSNAITTSNVQPNVQPNAITLNASTSTPSMPVQQHPTHLTNFYSQQQSQFVPQHNPMQSTPPSHNGFLPTHNYGHGQYYHQL